MLYKRSKTGPWWVRFTISGREVRVSSGTNSKKDAEEFERRLREQLWREIELGEVQHTWEEAKERWLKERAHKRSISRDEQAFAAVAHWLEGTALGDIDNDRLRDIGQALVDGREPGLRHQRKPATANRILACVRSVLNRCVGWGWLIRAPKVETQHVDKPPPRWATKEQFEMLWRELPTHARQIVRFSVAVGPRSGNTFRLQWRNVDFKARVFRVGADEFKGKRDVGFPLSNDAIEVLEQQRGQHPIYVFTDHLGRAPVGSIKTCWRKACKRAGLPGFRVHDLRHTWAAWHKLAGTPRDAIKELGGWSDARMVDRYGHINPEDYVQYVDNRRSNSGTSANQNRQKAGKN